MGFSIGVIGASGGVGASTLTAALVTRAHTILDSCRASLAVDLDPRGGLDTTLCLEHLDGWRWPELEIHAWDSGPGTDPTLAQLPGAEGVHVLAGRGATVPEWRLVVEVLAALEPQTELIAVDCGPRPVPQLLSRLDVLVLLAHTSARGLADLHALDRACPLGRTQTVLVTRGAPASGGSAAAARSIGLPTVLHLADDVRVARHAERGLAPGARTSAVDSIADELLMMADSAWITALVDRVPIAERSQ